MANAPKGFTLSKRADRSLWAQCICIGFAVGVLAGLPFHWHAVGLSGPASFLGSIAGVWAFYPIRRWRNRRHA
jgi:hypothetical protein